MMSTSSASTAVNKLYIGYLACFIPSLSNTTVVPPILNDNVRTRLTETVNQNLIYSRHQNAAAGIAGTTAE
jgi:hypothetical protein